jgi:putative endonuclease
MHDRIGKIPLAREAGIVARRPPRTSAIFERDESRGARGFCLGRGEQLAEAVEHRSVLESSKQRVARARTRRLCSAVSRARCSGIAAGDAGAPQTRDPGWPQLALSKITGVPVLRSSVKNGVSNDIARRVGEHKSGVVKAFTQRYKVNRLVYFEVYGSILEARARERALKRWRREWKFDLIEKLNPDWHDLSGDLSF